MLKMYAKTERMIDLLYTFTTRQWLFDYSNTKELWSSLSKKDRQIFWYCLEEFKWSPYIKNFYYGIREHILHEDISNVTEALAKNRKYVFINTWLIFFLHLYFKITRYIKQIHYAYCFSDYSGCISCSYSSVFIYYSKYVCYF